MKDDERNASDVDELYDPDENVARKERLDDRGKFTVDEIVTTNNAEEGERAPHTEIKNKYRQVK